MTRVVCHPNPDRLPRANRKTVVVQLYNDNPAMPGVPIVGGPVLRETRRLGIKVPQPAFDFMSVALAVTAADAFVLRDDADDRWGREIDLVVHVAKPAPWTNVIDTLQTALNFLSGDRWTIDVRGSGQRALEPQTRGKVIDISAHDAVCLFSGGLDSAIGAIDLIADGKRPLLVSHAYTGDSQYQKSVLSRLRVDLQRFAPNARPTRSERERDVSMRTRSVNFIAFGTVVASLIAEWRDEDAVLLAMPENGLIALNPPLTHRRLGSLSTRTAHPYFLGLMQQVIDDLGLPARIDNPCHLKTKGEMMRDCEDQATLATVASRTVSCGKWKRKSKQCGRCVPCLIRRAAFHRAGIADRTEYRFRALRPVLANEEERDDLLAMMLAVTKARTAPLDPWVSLSGPLPSNPGDRADLIDVFHRGMQEMAAFLQSARVI